MLAGGVTTVAFAALLRVRAVVDAAGEAAVTSRTLLGIRLFSMMVSARFPDKGIEYYQKGDAANYTKAAGQLEKAFQLDPTYSQAAYYLGLTYSALFDEDKAQQYYKKAIEIDPDYLEAHANYAGMLLDIGDVDEAIRQVNIVLVRQDRKS